MITFGTIHVWGADNGSFISWHATPTEYAKGRHAPITAIQARYQQTIVRPTFYNTQRRNCQSDLRKLLRTVTEFNPVGAIRDRLTSPAKNPWR